jgi:hypothetical protein
MGQMLEHLLAKMKAELMARTKATQHKMEADKRKRQAKMDKVGDGQEEMKAHHEEMMAKIATS